MLDEEAFEPTVTLSQSIEDTAVALIPEQQQVLELITHLTLYSSMLVVVTGPHGSGKTTLAYQLLHRSAHPDDIIVIDGSIMLGVSEILRRVGDLLQQPIPENRSVALELLKLQAQQKAELGRSLVVAIDQAEQLDTETLNELAQLALQIPQGLSIALFGLTGFEKNITGGPNQAPTHIQHLEPLSEYGAQQLLQQVYSPGQPLPLSEEEFTAIYRQSQGLVGALLLQAGDVFLATAEDKIAANHRKKLLKKGKIAEHFPVTHVLALLFLLVALLLSYFYKPNKEDAHAVEQAAVQPEDVLRGLPLPKEKPKAPKETANDFNFSESAEKIEAVEVVETEEAKPVSAQPQINDAPVQTKPKKAAKPQTTERSSTDRNQLKAIEQGFIVQLFGSYEQENAQKFKQDWQTLNTRLYLYETENNNRPWFVVVAGTYSNKNAASQAIKGWPAELQKASPWIRDIKTVQQGLR